MSNLVDRAKAFIKWLLREMDLAEAVRLDDDELKRTVKAVAVDGKTRIITDTPSSRSIVDYDQGEKN